MTIVLFDIDGTLIAKPSCERRLMHLLRERGLMRPRRWLATAWFIARYGARHGRHVLKKNKAYLSGLSRDDVGSIRDELVATIFAEALCGPSVERLRSHQRAGDELVLLTGAPDFAAEQIAAKLDVPRVVATVCAERGGRFLPRPPRQHPFYREKVTLAERVCRERGSTLAEATAYADSIWDAPLLTRVGRAVAVMPDRRLAAIARRRGWEIIEGGAAGHSVTNTRVMRG
jgi:HAD superfamily phosphoserine phosphatase-like hydrolase